jgi:outer membrane protein assembly factor BamB
VLTNVSGSFTAQPNLLEPLAPGQQATEPPAPPGIILKVNSIGGSGKTVNPLTDSKIFGYDPTTGQVVRFDLNLQSDRGTVDPTFAPISVPGAPANSDIDIAHDNGQLVLLATSGKTVYAYNADTGAPVGSFTAAVPVSFVASAGNITVLGSTAINQIHMINLPASLQTGTAQGLDSTSPFVPQPEVTLLGGLTGLAGSNNLYATVAAHFSTLQPDQVQLGIDSIGTLAVNASPRGSSVSDQFSLISRTGLVSNGNYESVQTNPIPPTQVGTALGAVDQNLALDTGVSNGNNNIKLLSPSSLSTQGSITLDYPDLLTGLSQSFRTDLGGTALIDIQGDVQSVRGNSVNGMFLNDTGNLATIKIPRVDNSTIVGQPISHIQVARRYNATFLTSSREVGNRNGAMQVLNIKPIGPTGLQGDS